ncbi:MAG TPA: PspC domain-containing protein [Terrimesophilobacter sp.]|nr:PspC domain-containing protein [Terrimesophilobacter sp.]
MSSATDARPGSGEGGVPRRPPACPHPRAVARPLLRPRTMLVAGVAQAVADPLAWPVTLVRWIFIATAPLGAGVLLYLWLWAFVPVESFAEEPVTRARPIAAYLLALGAAVGVLAVILANTSGGWPLVTGATAVLIGAAATWTIVIDPTDPARREQPTFMVRIGAAVALIAIGGLLLLAREARPDAVTAVFAVVMVLGGLAVILAPTIVSVWTERMAQRTARVREEQRAEIAAHLHDSVLQSLALIQNRAGASSEVARIARAQERELRDWLFAGVQTTEGDLATELRDLAAQIELDFPVRIDFVTAGGSEAVSNAAVYGAVREAMLNAARHAGGEVSVYLEATRDTIDVWVRDRGDGLDLEAIPDGRLGIRESIIGRMSRAGGTATVKPGSGGSGTEVHVHLDRKAAAT